MTRNGHTRVIWFRISLQIWHTVRYIQYFRFLPFSCSISHLMTLACEHSINRWLNKLSYILIYLRLFLFSLDTLRNVENAGLPSDGCIQLNIFVVSTWLSLDGNGC